MAFIIDTVAIKTSSKTGKKFAILRILDTHDESLELPIWSELFEINSHLLLENKLLWGVFTKEASSEGTSIQCRWLGDLKNCTEATLDQDAQAYSKASAQLERAKKRSAQKTEPKEAQKPLSKTEKPSKEKPKGIELRCDVTSLRASHILSLKQALLSHPGDQEVSLTFFDPTGDLSTLQLPSMYYVSWNKQLETTLLRISSIQREKNQK